jgi:hypothetical protein
MSDSNGAGRFQDARVTAAFAKAREDCLTGLPRYPVVTREYGLEQAVEDLKRAFFLGLFFAGLAVGALFCGYLLVTL